jgi:pimeloyl-ACP methyl ester carboxylesterase
MKNKTILITSGTTGIGLAPAKLLSAESTKVIEDIKNNVRSKFHTVMFGILALGAILLSTPTAAQTSTAAKNTTQKIMDASFDEKTFARIFSHRFSTVNGIRLHYVIGGKGDPIVLLHGYPETWYGWRKLMPALAEHYTVIAPDMRGLGESSIPADGDYTKKAVADDIYKLVQSLGMRRVYLVAEDMGASVALAYCGMHRDDVRSLIFMESTVAGFGLEEAGFWHVGFFAAPEFPEMLTKGREKEFFTAWAYRGDYVYQKATFTDADISEYVGRYTKPGGMTAGFGYYRAFAQDAKDNREFFAENKLTLPILAIGGEHGIGDLAEKNLKRFATNVTGLIIKDSGHFVSEEQPQPLAQAIFTFCAGK